MAKLSKKKVIVGTSVTGTSGLTTQKQEGNKKMARNAAAPKGKDLKNNKAVEYQEEMNEIMDTQARNIDDLALHDELMGGLLGVIRDDLRAGLPAEKILTKYANIAAARVATIAATDADSGKALAASKDILDRVYGKAREIKDVTHRLDKVDERQIDAILISELDMLEMSTGQEADDDE